MTQGRLWKVRVAADLAATLAKLALKPQRGPRPETRAEAMIRIEREIVQARFPHLLPDLNRIRRTPSEEFSPFLFTASPSPSTSRASFWSRLKRRRSQIRGLWWLMRTCRSTLGRRP